VLVEAAAEDAAPARRSRSRRGAKPAVETPVDAAFAAETAPQPVEAEAAPEPREPREPRRERSRGRDRDRNADRREAAPADEPRAGNGRPFGDADVPAFLRRPVTIKA
jgi:hypothetical protein